MSKKLIILGGNPETGALVNVAVSMGIHTIVIDPNPNAPAKKNATESFDIDGFDVDTIVKLAREKNVDGVLVGVADILVKPYREICDRLNMPCYANEKTEEAFCSKDGFKRYCLKHNIQDIPGTYVEKAVDISELDGINVPVMVKPVDNGGGVGMKICRAEEDFKNSVENALKFSKKGIVMVERYMQSDDMAAYYTFRNGTAYLSAISDRFTTKKQGDSSPACTGAIFPSKYTDAFVKTVHPQLCELFKDLEVQNGVLNIQFFVENGVFYAYDPGFRLQGEAPHLPIAHINKFDNREMLINFALSGTFGKEDFTTANDYRFRGKKACTVWVLLKEGEIGRIEGLEDIKSDKDVIFVLDRFKENDVVTPDMIGTERQVFSRIYIVADSIEDINKKVDEFKSLLRVTNNEGGDMILDWIPPLRPEDYTLVDYQK